MPLVRHAAMMIERERLKLERLHAPAEIQIAER
jgi:hypothetical protein